ncbi:MAG: hypothetical protein AB1508_03730 [Pseudomonadota bacterium]
MLEVVSNAGQVPAGAASLPPPLPPPLPPSDATPLELKVEPADAIFGPAPPRENLKEKETESTSPREGIGFFGRLFRFIARTTAVVLLCALAWAAGTFYSHSHWSNDPLKSAQAPQAQAVQAPQALQSPAHEDMAGAMQQMSDDIRALKASVDNKVVSQEAGAQNVQGGPSDSTQTTTAIANLAGRVDKLETDFTAKLSQVSEQLASIQQQLTASHAAAVARRAAVHKHVHDAFNPSQEPSAPGAPHPLGSAW